MSVADRIAAAREALASATRLEAQLGPDDETAYEVRRLADKEAFRALRAGATPEQILGYTPGPDDRWVVD